MKDNGEFGGNQEDSSYPAVTSLQAPTLSYRGRSKVEKILLYYF
jgi:hypothetical protein